ncbi:glutathione S-transferase [Panaeolus papilionaceus]|nr:glutathione S-transferase [Panaeolus papilionaceus]
MVLKLYGLDTSTCTRRAATVMHEKKVPFEFVNVNIFEDENRKEEYLAKQPFGQVPYLDDDGFILYESRAIARYIATKYADQGTPLIPKDIKDQALMDQAISVEMSNFNAYAEKAVAEMVFKPMRGLTPDKAVFDQLIADLNKSLEVYDQILGKQKYLAGDEITIADLFHLPYGSMLSAAGSDIMNSKPNVKKWFNDISSRPAWVAVKDGVKSYSG